MKNRNILILCFTLFVVMVGFGIIIPIIPYYIERLGASGREMGMLTAISALMQFIFAPFWGILSDRYGRKPILLVGMLGYGITMLLFGLANQLWMLFLARALNGMLSSGTMPTAMAYVADHCTQNERGRGMGQLGAAAGMGIVLGPGLGGVLATVSLSTPFFIAAGLCCIALPLVWFLLPESTKLESRQARREGKAHFQPRDLYTVLSGPMGMLMVLALVVSLGLSSFQSILGLYALDRFGYSMQEMGLIWVIVGVVTVLAQGALTGPMTRRFGEVFVIRISLIATAAAFGFMLVASEYLPFMMAISFLILCISLLVPALNSLMSAKTTLEQGITMGISTSFTNLGRIAGPLWAGIIYDVNIGYPFISGGAILLVGFLMSMVSGLRIQAHKEMAKPLYQSLGDAQNPPKARPGQ